MPNTSRPYSLEIKKRFVLAVEQITNELYPSKREIDIIKSLGFAPSNFYKLRTNDNCYPTLDHLAALCSLYDISEQWILSGIGTLKKDSQFDTPLQILKKAVMAIESELKMHESNSKSG